MLALTARRLVGHHRALLSAAAAKVSHATSSSTGLARPTTSHLYNLDLALDNPMTGYQQTRHRHSLPYNSVVVFVPQQEAWVVERMGKFHKILEPGLNILLPIVDSIRYVQSLKEMAFEIPQQSAVTSDNVTLSIDGVLYLRVFDPYKASYNIEDPEFSVTQLAQTSMRSEIGKIQLDSVFRERESLNTIIVSAINNATSSWGISCLRYEIRDIKLPTRVQEAMQLQVEAERKKRAQILESEGARDAEINVAQGQANAIITRARAKANALTSVSEAIKPDAAAFLIAEQYVKAFSNLARTNNTLIIPSDANDVNKMVAQAFQVYRSVSSSAAGTAGADGSQSLASPASQLLGGDEYLSDIEDAIGGGGDKTLRGTNSNNQSAFPKPKTNGTKGGKR